MVHRTRIKVCGITEQADLDHAVAAGVDALGFIFAEKSPRWIDPEKVRELVRSIPPFVDTVGVFVDEAPDVVSDIIKYCGLTMVQLHGREDVDYCRLMPVRVVKSFSVGGDSDQVEFTQYGEVAAGFLLDTYHESIAGGTGQTFDWGLVEKLNITRPVLLAGGLGPANVAEAIRVVRPYAVDVNSGVETAPGRKDHHKITELVAAVRKADSDL